MNVTLFINPDIIVIQQLIHDYILMKLKRVIIVLIVLIESHNYSLHLEQILIKGLVDILHGYQLMDLTE